MLCILLSILMFLPAVHASTSTLTGSAGDTSPAYLDITLGSITNCVSTPCSTLLLTETVDAAIPTNLQLQDGQVAVTWGWGLATVPGICVPSFPYEGKVGDACVAQNIFIPVVWDGSKFTAYLIDRTPMASGGSPTITSVPTSINGNQVNASVDLSMIGSPSSFHWIMRTTIWKGDTCLPLTPTSQCIGTFIDRVPTTGAGTFTV